MTALSVRNTVFASWIDPDAWMESMKGPRWKAILEEEEDIVNKVLNNKAIQERIGLYKGLLTMASDENQHILPFYVGPFIIHWQSDFFKTWNRIGYKDTYEVRDCLPYGDTMLAVQDVGNGSEIFELQSYSPNHKIPTWTKSNVGPSIAILDSKLFYLKARNILQYYQLWSCDVETGNYEKLIYTVKSPSEVCSLERLSDGRVYFLVEVSQEYKTYELTPAGSLIVRKTMNHIPASWILPLTKDFGIDFLWPSHGFIVIRIQGTHTLWKCSSNRSAKKILSIPVGTIQFDPWAVHAGRLPCIVRVSEPDKNLATYSLTEECSLTLLQPVVPTPLVTERFEGRSKDGTAVFGCITKMRNIQPKAMLVIGYGAYGIPTSSGSVYQRWTPLVKNGWAIVHTFLRGGGDHTESWAKEGRRQGRVKTVDDFCGLIQAARLETLVSPRKTVIYGRSAGGLVMGESLKRYSDGSLFRGVYTEVPYVDELRTTTNPSLPLSVLEYDEFGNPAKRLEDFIHVGLTSPVVSAHVIQTPSILVYSRTAEHDSQVFTYESVKWIRRLRAGSKGALKVCIVEKGQGHFTPPDMTARQLAIDCAVLDAWVDGDL